MAEKKLGVNNPTSPYYLNASDHLSYVISLMVLNGDNYGNWSRFCINGLKSKSNLAFVNDKITKHVADALEADALEKANSMVIVWLYNVIDKTLHRYMAYAKTIVAIWTNFEERYSQCNSIRIHQLK